MINPIQKRHDSYNPGTIAWNCPQRCDKVVRFDSYPQHVNGFTEFRIGSDRCLEVPERSFESKVAGVLAEGFWAQEQSNLIALVSQYRSD
jgi:hypothetical protein